MTARIDIISPIIIGEQRIGISVNPVSILFADRPITVDFDYTAATPGGVVLPLVVQVQPASGIGDGTGYVRKVFTRSRPSSFTFRVPESGEFLVAIAESAHNQWGGALVITVLGEEFSQILQERV